MTLSAAELDTYAGQFWSDEIGARYDVAVKDGKLVVKRFGFEEIPLEISGRDTFIGAFGTVEFRRTSDGAVNEFRLQGGRMKNLLFRRVGR